MTSEIIINARLDAFRPTLNFADLAKIVNAYYNQYYKAAQYIGPYISRNNSKTIFIPPDREQIKSALGREYDEIPLQARNAFISNLILFLEKNKGKKTLITPNPTTHHHAQFPKGTFDIEVVKEKTQLRDDKNLRKEVNTLHKISFATSDEPVYIENLNIPIEQIKFVILRPKMGKMAIPSITRWEVLLYKQDYGYLVEHCDSNNNPRYAGKY
jgi:hypothetical protein